MKPGCVACLLAALLLPAAAAAEDAAELPSYLSYDGTAVEPDDGSVLYRESHYVAMQGSRVLERLVLYRCADGTPFAPGSRDVIRTGDELLVVVPSRYRYRVENRFKQISRGGRLSRWHDDRD